MVLAMLHSGSRIEDKFWEQRIDALLTKNLRNSNQATLDAALTHAQDNYPEAYDMLADLMEMYSASYTLADPAEPDVSWDAVLVAAPILAWTRYTLPSGPLPKNAAKNLQEQLEKCIFAKKVRVGLAPHLYSIDQLPMHYVETWRLGQQMAKATLSNAAIPVSSNASTQTTPILADPRFLVAIVMAPTGQALFRWQEDKTPGPEARETCLTDWIEQANPILTNLLPGCEWQCLLPDALHCAYREADERIRPHSLNTAIRYLCEVLDLQPSALRAVVAAFGDKQITEYRISFTLRGANDVLYGMIWPIYEREEDETFRQTHSENEVLSPIDEITALLKKNDITDIRRYPSRLDLQYCDDCEAPLYADPHGEIVHAEMPEEADLEQPKLH